MAENDELLPACRSRPTATAAAEDPHARTLYQILVALRARYPRRVDGFVPCAQDRRGRPLSRVPPPPVLRDRYALDPGAFPVATISLNERWSLPLDVTLADDDLADVASA